MTPLPTHRACELQALPAERRWLIEGLWGHEAVGILGGEPKWCKSFLALDVAVAVASGAHCLRRFPVADLGPVVLFAAEDALHTVRERLEGIARAADVAFAELDIHVITAPTVRLDLQDEMFVEDVNNFIASAVDDVELAMRNLVDQTDDWTDPTVWKRFSQSDASSKIRSKYEPLASCKGVVVHNERTTAMSSMRLAI